MRSNCALLASLMTLAASLAPSTRSESGLQRVDVAALAAQAPAEGRVRAFLQGDANTVASLRSCQRALGGDAEALARL